MNRALSNGGTLVRIRLESKELVKKSRNVEIDQHNVVGKHCIFKIKINPSTNPATTPAVVVPRTRKTYRWDAPDELYPTVYASCAWDPWLPRRPKELP